LANASPVKHQREDETAVDDPAAMALILDALGFNRCWFMKSAGGRGLSDGQR